MQRLAIVCGVLGLLGCRSFPIGFGGGWGDGNDLRGNSPYRMCASATPGRARQACLAANGVAGPNEFTEQDRRAARETAESRRSRGRLEPRAETTTCLATSADTSIDGRDHASASHLDRALVANGISTVNARVLACGDASEKTGQVLVEVTVAARGCVAAVVIESTPDRDLGACVASALQHATFAPTDTGGAFRYPYTF